MKLLFAPLAALAALVPLTLGPSQEATTTSVAGQVVDSAGRHAPGIDVELIPAPGSRFDLAVDTSSAETGLVLLISKSIGRGTQYVYLSPMDPSAARSVKVPLSHPSGQPGEGKAKRMVLLEGRGSEDPIERTQAVERMRVTAENLKLRVDGGRMEPMEARGVLQEHVIEVLKRVRTPELEPERLWQEAKRGLRLPFEMPADWVQRADLRIYVENSDAIWRHRVRTKLAGGDPVDAWVLEEAVRLGQTQELREWEARTREAVNASLRDLGRSGSSPRFLLLKQGGGVISTAQPVELGAALVGPEHRVEDLKVLGELHRGSKDLRGLDLKASEVVVLPGGPGS